MHIILIDDTQEHLELLAEFISELRPGAAILTLQDGRELPEVLMSGWPDLVLMDLLMPTVNGFALVEWLRAEVGRQVPIIAVSGLRSGISGESLVDAGFDELFAKPYNFVELAELLDRYLPI